jgi:protein TonB
MLPGDDQPGDMMLRTLLESQANPKRGVSGTAISIGVHTAIIGAAIVATARATTRRPEAPPPSLIYRAEPVPPSPRPQASSTNRRDAGALVVPKVLVPPVDIPKHLPPIDITKPITHEGDFDTAPINLGVALPGGSPHALGSGNTGPLTSEMVDQAAVPRSDNPRPTYPAALRAASIEGNVVARFVIDTGGRAEPNSIEIVETTHALFADAVRQALLRSRYLPATLNGHPVRQLVEQRFAFTLDR